MIGNDNERLRHIRLHERVNDLPDPNYSTLKYFMGHLHKCEFSRYQCTHVLSLFCRVVQYESENAMSVQNIAIVFGPTLFGLLAPGMNGQMNGMADAGLQNKVSEILIGRSCVSLKGAFSPPTRVPRATHTGYRDDPGTLHGHIRRRERGDLEGPARARAPAPGIFIRMIPLTHCIVYAVHGPGRTVVVAIPIPRTLGGLAYMVHCYWLTVNGRGAALPAA